MRRLLLAALLAALPLAGCVADEPMAGVDGVPLAALSSADLEPGGFYAFPHAGGVLAFSIDGNGSAQIELFDAADRRVGRLEVGAGLGQTARHELAGVAMGEPVLHVLARNGTLRVESGGRLVDGFEALGVSAQRAVLVNRAPPVLGAGIDVFGVLTSDPADETLSVALQRAPAGLRLLASGDFTNLDVVISSARGPVLVAQAAGGAAFYTPEQVQSPVFYPVDSAVHPENFSEGQFEAHVTASDLSGALVLEAVTYSRAEAPGARVAAVTTDVPRFTYGRLPSQPVEFQVAPSARFVYLWQEGSDGNGVGQETPATTSAWVALYGPDDVKLASVQVAPNVTVAVPVTRTGDFVAVLLSGVASLGSDQVPSDFELHPLGVGSAVAPGNAAGRDGEYGQSSAAVLPVGVPYAFAAAARDNGSVAGFPTFAPCSGDGLVRVEQAGEAILLVGDIETPLADGALRLSSGEITVVWDDFGEDACQHPAVEVLGYLRNSSTSSPT